MTADTAPGPARSPNPSASEVLSVTVEGDFFTQLELSQEEQGRLYAGGAGALIVRYHARIREQGQALARLVEQFAAEAEDMRKKVLLYHDELLAGDELDGEPNTSSSEDGASVAGSRSADAGDPARPAADDDHQTRDDAG